MQICYEMGHEEQAKRCLYDMMVIANGGDPTPDYAPAEVLNV